MVSHTLTTLGSIDEDIVSWFEFRARTSRKLTLVLVEFDCIITTTKRNDVVQQSCWSNLRGQLPYNEPLLTCYSTDPLHGDGAAAERYRPPTRAAAC